MWELLKFQLCIKIVSFNAWISYFVWNFKVTLWNSTQNILPIHGKMCILFTGEIERPLRFKSSYVFLKLQQNLVNTVVADALARCFVRLDINSRVIGWVGYVGLPSKGKDSKYLHHLKAAKWRELQISFHVSTSISVGKRLSLPILFLQMYR